MVQESKVNKKSSLLSIFQRWGGGGATTQTPSENHAAAMKYTRHQWEGFIEKGTPI